ncbi:MAG: hypothetical protein N4A71_03450 [Carboxylicivirga sp.]|nr:hypothetical protein [Carboxylicivirga sp.]
MKLKIYSISLLVSFLAILSHQMIPHHHHDDLLDSVSISQIQVEEHVHHDSHGHHHHHDNNHSDETHSHSFPPHNHSLASEEYSFARLIVDSGTTLKVTSFIVLYIKPTESIDDQLLIDKERRYSDIPFLINSLFQPGAIGLRAPPCMA